MDIFKKQINIINENNYIYYNPVNFDNFFEKPDAEKKILVTIDDAFSSFYENAWPYLKKNKIPFILFSLKKSNNNFENFSLLFLLASKDLL